MLNKLSCMMTRATIVATILIMSGAAAIGQHTHGGASQDSKQSQGMMNMSAMMQEPHHVLAMAYRDSLVTFAKSLGHHAEASTSIDSDFARAAVAEMERSFDQMQQHHQDCMKTMDASMKVQMADMMQQMDAHDATIKEHLDALDKEVHGNAPDAKSISSHVADILKHCDGMAKKHGEAMDHKMGGPKAKKTN